MNQNLFQIDYDVIYRNYQHLGILGKGLDFIYELPCVIHLMKNKKTNKKVVLQVYPKLTSDYLCKKMNHLSKANYDNNTGNWIKIIAYAEKKINADRGDLNILYDFDSFSSAATLESLIQQKKKDNQSFTEQEILSFIKEISEALYIGSSQCGEYFDITPSNIYYVPQGPGGRTWFVSNFNLSFKNTKWEKKFYSPLDRFYTGKISERQFDMALRAATFSMGMIALYMATGEDNNSCYILENKNIDRQKIHKKIDQLKKKEFSESFCEIINNVTHPDEHKRTILKNMIQAFCKEEKDYYTGFIDEDEYNGYIKSLNPEGNPEGHIIPHGNGEYKTKNYFYKGTFVEGKKEGLGIECFKENDIYCYGTFAQDEFSSGYILKANQYIWVGDHVERQPMGEGVQFFIQANHSENECPSYFDGEIQSENKKEGVLMYNDGSYYNGPQVNDKKDGTGILQYSRNYTIYNGPFLQFEGEFQEDKKIHGTMAYRDGSFYTGGFKNEKRQGENGKYCMATKIFEGNFVNDKMHGIFKVKDKNNEDIEEEIEFDMGVRCKIAKQIPSKNQSFEQSQLEKEEDKEEGEG